MARQLRQARAVLRAATDYLRHDLPEIVFPSSIPTPPGMDAPEARTPRREFGAVCCPAVMSGGGSGCVGAPTLPSAGSKPSRLHATLPVHLCALSLATHSSPSPPLDSRPASPQLFLRVCRRYAETWDAKKMRAERAARDAQHATVQERRREEEGPTLGEEFGAWGG